jgi:hypothetical protein
MLEKRGGGAVLVPVSVLYIPAELNLPCWRYKQQIFPKNIESVTDIIKKMAQNHERRLHNHPNTEAIQLLNYNGDSTGPSHWNCVSARSDLS